MKRCYLRAFCLLGFVQVLAPNLISAQSRLLGDQYTLSYTNFPGDLGVTFDPEEDRPRIPLDHGSLPAIVTIDGNEEIVGGMRVNERVVEFDGIAGGIPVTHATGIDGETEVDLVEWENAGEIVEFAWDTVSGGYISDEELEHSFITITDLNWQNSDPGSAPELYDTGWYMYYTDDGQGVTGYETLVPDALLVGAHPFDKSVEEVFYIGYSRSQVDDIALTYEGGIDLTFGTTQLSPVASWLILAEAMGLAEQNDGVNGLRIGFLVNPPSGQDPSIPGDFDGDGLLTGADIDDLTAQSASMMNLLEYDLNADTLVDEQDAKVWIKDLFGSWVGDADLDGQFDSGDLVVVLASGAYEADIDSVWTTGDFNGNGRTDSGDLVSALADGGYEAGPRAAVAAVPEPSGLALFTLAGATTGYGLAGRRSSRRR